MNENTKNLIAVLINEYDIESADDSQKALKNLLWQYDQVHDESWNEWNPGVEKLWKNRQW